MALVVQITQDPDGRFRAHAPSMPEAIGHGKTPDEARDQARAKAAQLLVERAEVTHKNGWVFVHCPEIDVSNQGETLEEAQAGLQETLFLYLSDD